MYRTYRRSSGIVRGIVLLAALSGFFATGSMPAFAQSTCQSSLVMYFPNGDNLNRVVGQHVVIWIEISAGPMLDQGVQDTQSFSTLDFFPSCLSLGVSGCNVDQGATPGPPPPVEFFQFGGTTCAVVPTVDSSDPFDVKFSFNPPLTMDHPEQSCLVQFEVQTSEPGDPSSTPAEILQLALTQGTCGSGLSSIADSSSLITLTCPPCDDGNVCTIDTCIGFGCAHSTPPDCDDRNICTVDTCTGPNPGDCAHSTPPNCDDGNVCTGDTCTGPNPDDCTHTPPPHCDNPCMVDSCPWPGFPDCPPPPNCDDGNPCTTDACVSPTECSHSTPPDCDDHNVCTIDTCTGPNPGDCAHSTPPNCDDSNVCSLDECTGPNPGDCAHSIPPPCDDGNACTYDTCRGPIPEDCLHSAPMSCDDGNPCTTDACVSPTECSHSTPPDCDDHNVCTIDTCTGPNPGDCAHSTPPDCSFFETGHCESCECMGPSIEDCRCNPPVYCDDGNVCTIDVCTGPNPNDCSHTAPPDCDDHNMCTIDTCTGPNPGDCVHATLNCDDGNICTIDTCTGPTGCSHVQIDCDDGNPCTDDYCNGGPEGYCLHYGPPNCDDGNVCTNDFCTGPDGTDCGHAPPPDCDDHDVCTDDVCTGPNPGDCSHVPSALSQTCGTGDACVDRGCDPTSGCVEHDHSSECGSSETCVVRGCDPATGCFEHDPDPVPPECEEPQPGCRVAAGGVTPHGGADSADLAHTITARFEGQVDASCGCIGCGDSLDQVQGSWESSRKVRQGTFHALNFNSLVCGCGGVLDGKLCPEPGSAQASVACFSGIGSYNPTNGRRDIRVAFRVEVEDRGEPGHGKAAPDDVYRIRIWIPGENETAEGLADQACCSHASPPGRDPNIDDGGGLIHGNIEIHPTSSTGGKVTCPEPNGTCQQ